MRDKLKKMATHLLKTQNTPPTHTKTLFKVKLVNKLFIHSTPHVKTLTFHIHTDSCLKTKFFKSTKLYVITFYPNFS